MEQQFEPSPEYFLDKNKMVVSTMFRLTFDNNNENTLETFRQLEDVTIMTKNSKSSV